MTKRRRLAETTGFSLVEVLVSLAIMIIVVIGMAAVFDRSAQMAKTENSVTDAQQSARYGSYQVVREARMAGAGAVPASITLVGTTHQVGVSLNLGSTFWGTTNEFASNNFNSGATQVMIGGTHHVRKGTDILHIRGVISNAVYDLGSSSWSPPGAGSTIGTLIVNPCSKYADPTALTTDACYPNANNDMSLFASNSSYPIDRLFVMSDALGNLGIGVITHAGVSVVSSSKNSKTVYTATLSIDVGDSSSPNTTYSQTLNGGGVFPAGLTSPSRGGVLDDRVYFIDDGTATSPVDCFLGSSGTTKAVQEQVPGPCHPVLSYADWATGDSSAAPFSTATVTPMADDVEDLQVAYGIDFYDTTIGSGTLASPAPTRNDTTGLPLNYPSDGSLSRTYLTGAGGFTTIVTAAQGSSGPNLDPSEDTSDVGKDEWVGNVAGEITTVGHAFDLMSDLSRLRALEISILAKGSNPDPLGRVKGTLATPAWAGAFAWPLMDNTSPTVSQPASGTAFPYHRRLSTVRVNLRNFNLQ